MGSTGDIDLLVFDVLGTLVDQPTGLRIGIRDVLPDADEPFVDELLTLWQGHVTAEQERIAEGSRAYVSTETIDREAAQRVLEHAGTTDAALVSRLAAAAVRLPPWPDSVSSLERLAQRFPLVGLSNASSRSLLQISAHAGLRWHQALSADSVHAYKPSPEVYRLAVDTAGVSPNRILMIAAHAWDLRGAQAVGMKAAYVHRPIADPPAASDAFDGRFESLHELAVALTAS